MSPRKRLLARIHIVKAELGWDEDEYRDYVFAETGKDSAGDVDYVPLANLLKRMEALRRQRKAAAVRAAGDPAFDNTALTTKCLALAYDLTADGDIAGASMRANRYLAAVAARICASGKWETATAEDLTKLVAALSIEQDKRAKRAN